MPQFTQGKWFYEPKSGYIRSEHDGTYVAHIVGAGCEDEKGEEAQANARLIATAPEMYDLLCVLHHEDAIPENLPCGYQALKRFRSIVEAVTGNKVRWDKEMSKHVEEIRYLKHCPFCGGYADLLPHYEKGIEGWRAECCICFASAKWAEDVQTAIDNWNNRTGSSRFFTNTDCEYYPCHENADKDNFNCLFCYCPLYHMEHCPGNPLFLPNGIKDCSSCILPHADYDAVIKALKQGAK